MNVLEKLRTKPERTRQTIAVVFSFAIVLVVAVGWIATFPGRYGSLAHDESAQEKAASPFRIFAGYASESKGSVEGLRQQASAVFFGLQQDFSELSN